MTGEDAVVEQPRGAETHKQQQQDGPVFGGVYFGEGFGIADGDYVVMLGAGNITQWAAQLPVELGRLIGKEPELP